MAPPKQRHTTQAFVGGYTVRLASVDPMGRS
jgi:hypothetical protein